ncbi:MAG: hypothetical protein Ct9H300mP23_01880 [Nitrospinota bacterium]|nr:MAG: hypothetical protein Ct9H300mP23_01880 [Nitrospinota bacterium]
MGSGVTSINAEKGTVESINLENGEKLAAKSHFFYRLCGNFETLLPKLYETEDCETGQISFMESFLLSIENPRFGL